jgi:hypothetical protein
MEVALAEHGVAADDVALDRGLSLR